MKPLGGYRYLCSAQAAGESVGITFTGACDRAPNSTEAHALLAYAAQVAPDKQTRCRRCSSASEWLPT